MTFRSGQAVLYFRLGLPVYAAGLVWAYIFMLEPASGAIGGVLFLLTSWAIPTLVVCAVAVWIALLLPVKRSIQVAVSLVLSLLLGLNFSLVKIVNTWLRERPTVMTVKRVVLLEPSDEIDGWMRTDNYAAVGDPLSSPVAVSGDEGCGCMYFVPNPRADLIERATKIIESTLGKSIIAHRNYSTFPNMPGARVRIRLWFEKSQNSENLLNFHFDIYEGIEETASFIENDIPFDRSIRDRIAYGRFGNQLKNNFFYVNVAEMLLHDNYWTDLFGPRFSYLNVPALRQFLRATFVRGGVAK